MPKITNEVPKNWKRLQEEVARLLRECGFRVEEPLTLETARGKVEVDVFAEEIFHGRQHTIICECKHWKSNIPKNVIHAFRTILADTGANVGYIIASKGFQSGAEPAAEFTNLKLLTWADFQKNFEATWLRSHWVHEVNQLWRLMVWFADEDGGENIIQEVRDKDKATVRTLFERYVSFAYFVKGQWIGSKNLKNGNSFSLPLSAGPFEIEGLPSEIMDAECYRSFLSAERSFALAGISELQDILKRNGHSRAPFLANLWKEIAS